MWRKIVIGSYVSLSSSWNFVSLQCIHVFKGKNCKPIISNGQEKRMVHREFENEVEIQAIRLQRDSCAG